MEEPTVGLDNFDATHKLVFISEFEEFVLDLERLVVSKSNHVWDALENRLVHRDPGVGVDRVVCQVQKLDDLGLVMFVFDNFPGHLLL